MRLRLFFIVKDIESKTGRIADRKGTVGAKC